MTPTRLRVLLDAAIVNYQTYREPDDAELVKELEPIIAVMGPTASLGKIDRIEERDDTVYISYTSWFVTRRFPSYIIDSDDPVLSMKFWFLAQKISDLNEICQESSKQLEIDRQTLFELYIEFKELQTRNIK